jgi:hypothetical protein
VFTKSSAGTPSPITGGGVIDASDTEVDEEEQVQLIKYSPLLDVVRVWEAPYAGAVKVEGTAQLHAPAGSYDADAYEKADGVRMAIHVSEEEKWSKKIEKGYHTVYNANIVLPTAIPSERIYIIKAFTSEVEYSIKVISK